MTDVLSGHFRLLLLLMSVARWHVWLRRRQERVCAQAIYGLAGKWRWADTNLLLNCVMSLSLQLFTKGATCSLVCVQALPAPAICSSIIRQLRKIELCVQWPRRHPVQIVRTSHSTHIQCTYSSLLCCFFNQWSNLVVLQLLLEARHRARAWVNRPKLYSWAAN